MARVNPPLCAPGSVVPEVAWAGLRRVLPPILLLILVLVLGWSSLQGGFVWDDTTFFVENDILPRLKPWMLDKILFRPSTYWGELVPLRELLLVIEYSLFGALPTGYHMVSLILYWLVGLALYSFLGTFLSCDLAGHRVLGLSPRRVAALLISLLFLAHPLHVEVFAYVASQKDLLFALFSLASMAAFWRLFNDPKTRKQSLVFGFVCFYLALASKLFALALTLFVPLLYLLSNRAIRPQPWRSLIVWCTANIPALLWVLYRMELKEQYWLPTIDATSLPVALRLVRAVKILGAHTALCLNPTRLSFGYPFDDGSQPDLNFLIGLLTLAGAGVLGWRFRKNRTVLLGIGIYLLFLLPALQLQSSQQFNLGVYDRYLFLPLLGLLLLLERAVAAGSRRARYPRAAYLAAGASLLLVFSALTWSYVPSFRSDVASTENSYRKYPHWSASAFNYVYSLIEAGELSQASAVLQKEPSFDNPQWVRGYFGGWIALEQGRPEEAIAHLRPSSWQAVHGGYFPYPNLPYARALIAAGRRAEAVEVLGQVLRAPVYHPLEAYRAKKLLENLGVPAPGRTFPRGGVD